MVNQSLKNKKIIISAGASGIGLATVKVKNEQFPRFRGNEFVWYDDRCTACASCAKYCPLGIIEIVRGYIFTGFPWNLIVYSFSNNIEFILIGFKPNCQLCVAVVLEP